MTRKNLIVLICLLVVAGFLALYSLDFFARLGLCRPGEVYGMFPPAGGPPPGFPSNSFQHLQCGPADAM
jgi:hypothetical protein